MTKSILERKGLFYLSSMPQSNIERNQEGGQGKTRDAGPEEEAMEETLLTGLLPKAFFGCFLMHEESTAQGWYGP